MKEVDEALCADCPLRHMAQEFAGSLAMGRINCDRPEDRRLIGALANSQAVMAALHLERPERCEALRQELPPVRQGPRLHSAAACPEWNLVAKVVFDYSNNEIGV